MSKIPSANEILQWVDRLRAALEEFGARAQKIEAETRTLIVRQNHSHEKALQEHRTRVATELEAARVGDSEALARVQKGYESRKARIIRAGQTSKELGLQRVEQRVGAKRYELQKRMLQAERERDAAYASAAERLQRMRDALAQEQTRVLALEAGTRSCLKGYGSLQKAAATNPAAGSEDKSDEALLTELRAFLDRGESAVKRCKGFLPGLFRYPALWIVLAVLAGGAAAWLRTNSSTAHLFIPLVAGAAGLFVIGVAGRFAALSLLKSQAAESIRLTAAARATFDACVQKSEGAYTTQVEQVRDQFASASRSADQELRSTTGDAGERRVSCRMEVDEQAVRATKTNERIFEKRMGRLRATIEASGRGRERELGLVQTGLEQGHQRRLAEISANAEKQWGALQEEWTRTVPPIYEALALANRDANALFPAWKDFNPADWKAPKDFVNAAKFGSLAVDLTKASAAIPQRLNNPASSVEAPMCLTFPGEGSLLLETSGAGQEQAIQILNNVVLRLLVGTPPGRANFTLIDPVGLGQNFSGLMHIADYEEQIINNRIWTQAPQIEEKLAQINEHMEKVIQMYLRNEYATIAEYNEQAGVIAEKYHYLVVADFPSGFTDTAARRLLSIAASGPRCGVYTLIHWDKRQQLPPDLPAADLRKSSLVLNWRGAEFHVQGRTAEGEELLAELPPEADKASDIIHTVGKASKDSSRVEVPFEHVAPEKADMWTGETSSELRVAIGRTGATKLQYLAFGKGTRQHGLVAGKTGSGKSTLFHVIITNLGMWCSPEEVEFYLVDFKKGVEFKCYATHRLPHAKVVAIESDREFGLSVLQRVDEELRRRGDLFRSLGVQDIPGYKRQGGREPMPRTLLLVDEFQEFFVEDDKIAQTASLLLDRIVRQGRAFGIHVLLGSQTLGGAYTVARTTLGQMVVRIALQCNEADAYMIFEDDNPAPRLLSRPGEAIYNDAAGAIEGNSPFQVVWLPDEHRDLYLEKIRDHAAASGRKFADPVVFEGNAPSEVRDNGELLRTLELKPEGAPVLPKVWLGAPNSIKGPTEASFKRQSGNNVLIVGQREEAILAMFSLAALALSAQYPKGAAEILLFDNSAPGSAERKYIDDFIAAKPRNVTLVRGDELAPAMKRMAARKQELEASGESGQSLETYLLIHGLQRFPKLKHEDDFGFSSTEGQEPSPGAVLSQLLMEGARLGFHVMASCDAFSNLTRLLSRKAIAEFEMRVVFQMSANDSASLVDNPKASTLGLHRALFHNAQEGFLETFRPYALPPHHWIRSVAETLK